MIINILIDVESIEITFGENASLSCFGYRLPMTDLRKSLILRKFVITALCHIFLG